MFCKFWVLFLTFSTSSVPLLATHQSVVSDSFAMTEGVSYKCFCNDIVMSSKLSSLYIWPSGQCSLLLPIENFLSFRMTFSFSATKEWLKAFNCKVLFLVKPRLQVTSIRRKEFPICCQQPQASHLYVLRLLLLRPRAKGSPIFINPLRYGLLFSYNFPYSTRPSRCFSCSLFLAVQRYSHQNL